MSSSSILAIGQDPVLLKTRSQVLRAAGFAVVSVFSLSKAISHALEGDFDLILLCHSIPVQIRERLVQRIREHTCTTPIVTVAAYSAQVDLFADVTVENDPEHLVADLHRVLQENKRSSRDGKILSEGVLAPKLPGRRSGA
jgi:DNA-binding response OmpR family regulator